MPSTSSHQSNYERQMLMGALPATIGGGGAGALFGGAVGALLGYPELGVAIGGGVSSMICFNGAIGEGVGIAIAKNISCQKANFRVEQSRRQDTWRLFEPSIFVPDTSVSQGLRDFQAGCLLVSVILGGMLIAFAVVDGGGLSATTAATISSIGLDLLSVASQTAATISSIGLDLLSVASQTIDQSILPELFNALDKARAGGESALQGVSQILTGFPYYDEILRGSVGGALGYLMSKTPLFEKLVKTLFINSKLADALPGAKTYGQEYTSKVITSLKRYFYKEKNSKFEVKTFEDFVAEKVAEFLKEKFPEKFPSNQVNRQDFSVDEEVLRALNTAKSGTFLKGELHIEKLQQQYSELQLPSPIVQADYWGSLKDSCLGTGRKS